jgi:hypothetical protein
MGSIKLRSFYIENKQPKELKNNLQSARKYLQIIYMILDQ